MPDAALSATEQQFMRLIGYSNVAANVYIYPFSIGKLGRRHEAMTRVHDHYFDFSFLADRGLHAMIITGANVIEPDITKEPIWQPLIEIADWAYEHTASTLCSCLASHALAKHSHNLDRKRMARKHWGVYRHQVRDPSHPLMHEVPDEFDTPHSRWNDISTQQFEAAGLAVLASGDDAGVHLAVSEDGIRIVYTQGHPEYDSNSLLKEYKREVLRYLAGELDDWPPYPENYLPNKAREIAAGYLADSADEPDSVGEFPEEAMAPYTKNNWSGAGHAIMHNWLDLVLKTSNPDPKLQFANGVDPGNPLAHCSFSQNAT